MRAQVELGPRPPGSLAAERCRAYIRAQLPGWSWQEYPFTARTPLGPLAMVNLVAVRPQTGLRPPSLVIAAHYDTKLFADFEFVGANDGASGIACLLELGGVLEAHSWRHSLVLACLDGEEALVEWGPRDGLYGSSYQAWRWRREGLEIGALLVLDMVGDRQLRLAKDVHSTAWLRELVWEEAERLGYQETFAGSWQAIEDDHIPFLLERIPSLDLIGFARLQEGYYPGYWHTPDDTLDKVCPESLEAVGRVVESALLRLDREDR